MTWRWLVLFVLLVLGIPQAGEAACSGSGTTWSCPAGATIADVNAMIASATDGATATFAVGSYAWSGGQIAPSPTKALTMSCISTPQTIGAALVNRCDVGTTSTVFKHTASSTKLWRITGFTFTHTGQYQYWNCPGGGCPAMTITSYRYDHNTVNLAAGTLFFNVGEFGGTGSTDNFVYGVLDHNAFTAPDVTAILTFMNGNTKVNHPLSGLGTANNFFIEDNTFTITTQSTDGAGIIDNNGGGGGFVFRHNTVLNSRVLSHGTGHAMGPMNWEVYQNTFNMTSAFNIDQASGYRRIHHQGAGTMMAFNNVIGIDTAHGGNSSSVNQVVVQHTGGTQARSLDGTICDGTASIDENRAGESGYPCFRQPGRDVGQVLSPIYVWNNTVSDAAGKKDLVCESSVTVCTKHVVANRDYYNAVSASAQTSADNCAAACAPFNGSTGMGFGRLLQRPTTCSTAGTEAADAGHGGVGYFATNDGPQGKLYTCTATNTWTFYYQPFTYPHTLVGGSPPDTTAPAAPTGLMISQLHRDH